MNTRQNGYSPNMSRRNYIEQQQQQHINNSNNGDAPLWTSSPMPHLFPHPLMSRMTNAHGQSVDIYENPSEHYSSIEPQQQQQQQQQPQSAVDRFLPTMQPAHSRTHYAGLKPRYYMESNNGPQLKVGYGKLKLLSELLKNKVKCGQIFCSRARFESKIVWRAAEKLRGIFWIIFFSSKVPRGKKD